jgi:hypothetical protein
MPPADSAGGIDFMHNNVESHLYISTKSQAVFLRFAHDDRAIPANSSFLVQK